MFLQYFWMFFFTCSKCSPLLFFKTTNPSSRKSPKSFLLYFLYNIFNIYMPTSLHYLAPSSAPIDTSNKPYCFLAQLWEQSNSIDFLAWFIRPISGFEIYMYSLAKSNALFKRSCVIEGQKPLIWNIKNLIRCLSFSELSHLMALTGFYDWLILVAWNNFIFILSMIVLLVLPSSFLAELIRHTFRWFKEFSLWPLIVIKRLDSALTSILSKMLSNDFLTISFNLSLILFLMFPLGFL